MMKKYQQMRSCSPVARVNGTSWVGNYDLIHRASGAVHFSDKEMIVDAVDSTGRRYLEVPVFPDGELKRAFADERSDECNECRAPIRHGFDRYFQRNDSADGCDGDPLVAALLAMTFDFVCAACGDRLIREGST